MPEMRQALTERGCPSETHNYLGDGVYCGYDGMHIWLLTDRFGTLHEIALEEPVLAALYGYARQHIKEPTT